ncbi:hypothetical protein PFISCL1PPCAC_8642, partial [Pristionchus fissidentatus]
ARSSDAFVMIRLIVIFLSAFVITTQSRNHAVIRPPPYKPDYSEIIWEQCRADKEREGLCLVGLKGHNDCHSTTLWDKDDKEGWNDVKIKDLLQGMLRDDEKCNTGIFIKSISLNKWLFVVQLFVSGVDYTEGVRLILRDTVTPKPTPPSSTTPPTSGGVGGGGAEPPPYVPDELVLFNCVPRADTPYIETDLDFTNEHIAFAFVGHNTSFFELDRILCSFTLESPDKKDIIRETLPNVVVKGREGREVNKWAMVLQAKPMATTETTDSWKWKDIKLADRTGDMKFNYIASTMEEREGKCSLNYAEFPKNLGSLNFFPLYPSYELSPVNTDFNNLACEDPLAKIIYKEDIRLYAVHQSYCEEDLKFYYLKFGATEAKINYMDSFSVACGIADCIHCDPLPLLDAPASSFPTAKYTDARDCPEYFCPTNFWTVSAMVGEGENRTEQILTLEAFDSPQCVRNSSDRDVFVWKLDDYELTGAACTQEAECPELKFDDNGPAKVKRNKTDAFCPLGLNVKLSYNNGDNWVETTSLHCDNITGTWYTVGEPDKQFNHSHQLRCEEKKKEEDSVDMPLILSIVITTIAVPLIAVTAFFCVKLGIKRNQMARVREEGQRMKRRPISLHRTTYPNLGAVMDVASMEKDDFNTLIAEFQLYSINERVQFVENLINGFGTKCEIDHYLLLFTHCIEMEPDHHVWKKLILGYKMILIGCNQVNKSRYGLKLNEYLKRCANRMLDRIGWEPGYDEDEQVPHLRAVVFHMLFMTNCIYTNAHMIEEFMMTGDATDPSRRKFVWAFGVRYGGKFDDVRQFFVKAFANTEPENEEIVRKWGSKKNHIIYALCSSKNHEHIEYMLNKLIEECPSTNEELLWAFRACVEDCFDLRIAAREAFKKHHELIKNRMPVTTPEYREIFEMFSRYAYLDFTGEDNWLIKFVSSPGTYTIEEKRMLPLALMAERGETYRIFLKKCLTIKEYTKDLKV